MPLIPLNKEYHVSADLTLKTIRNSQGKIKITDGMILKPGMYFITFNEKINLSKNQTAFIDGKSSLARLGFSVIKSDHSILSYNKYSSTLPLQILMPIKIYKNMPIAQIIINDNSIESERANIPEIFVNGSSNNNKLTLSNELYHYQLAEGEYLDPQGDNSFFLRKIEILEDGLELKPLELYLSITNESVTVNNGVAMLTTPGISDSNQATGILSIEQASLIKDGWKGRIALEIVSYMPGNKLYPNMVIGTLTLLGSTSILCVPESSKYNEQNIPVHKKN